MKRGDQDTCVVEPFKHRAAEERETREREAVRAAAQASKEQHIRQLEDRLRQLEQEREMDRLQRVAALTHPVSSFPTPASASPYPLSAPTPSAGEWRAQTSPSVVPSGPDPTVANEVHALKNRMQQLEALLLAQAPSSAPSAAAVTPAPPESPTSQHLSRNNGPARPPTDAEDAVSMLETLVHSSQVAASRQAITCSERMADRMTMSKLVHQHNSSQPGRRTPQPPHEPRKRKRGNSSSGMVSDGDKGKETTSCLGAKHDGFLKVYNGSETRLGFGIGWAFAAAAEKGEFYAMRQAYPGGLGKGNAEREAVLRAILRTLPSRENINVLVDAYLERANFLTTRVIHPGQFKKEVSTLLACTDEASRAHVMNQLDAGWLALLLMVLVLGLKFSPCPNTQDGSRGDMGLLNASCTLNCWYSSAKTVVTLCGFGVARPTLPLIQALLLIDIHGAEDEATMGWLQLTTAHNARTLGIDRLGELPAPSAEESQQEIILRHEMQKRVWWAIVSMEWYRTPLTNGVCTIHPEQFTTPLPRNYNDSDLLLDPVPPPRPMSEYTDTSYSHARVALGATMRQQMDMVVRRTQARNDGGKPEIHLTTSDVDDIDANYRGLLEARLPEFYRIRGYTPKPSVVLERALLHSIIFSQLLRLHRFSLSSRPEARDGLVGGRDTCVLLARSMLNALGTLQQGLTAIGRLACLRGHVFQASAVLMLDLCRRQQQAGERTRIRQQVMNAVAALHCTLHLNPLVKRSLRILLALLAEEQVQWEARVLALGTTLTNSTVVPPAPGADTMLSLASRIKTVLDQAQSDDLTPDEVSAVKSALAASSQPQTEKPPPTPKVLHLADLPQPSLNPQARDELALPVHPLLQSTLPFVQGPLDNLSASQQLFLPTAAERLLHFANVLPTPSLGGQDEIAFDLSAFLTQHQPSVAAQTQTSPQSTTQLAGTQAQPVQFGQPQGSAQPQQSGQEVSPVSPTNPCAFSSASSASVDTPQQLQVEAAEASPVKAQAAAVPPLDYLPCTPSGVGVSSGTGAQDPTSIDSFWKWILDQGGIFPVDSSVAPAF